MANLDKYTPAQVIAALQATGGVRSIAAEKLGCSPSTVTRYIDTYPEVADALVEIKDMLLDLTEGKLIELIRQGSEKSIHFYLRTQGKHRGFTERVEQTGKDGAPLPAGGVVTVFQLPDNGRQAPPAPDGGAS